MRDACMASRPAIMVWNTVHSQDCVRKKWRRNSLYRFSMRRERPHPGVQPGGVFRFPDQVAMLDVAPLHSFAREIAVELLPQSWRDSDLDRANLSQQSGIAVMIGLTEFALQFS